MTQFRIFTHPDAWNGGSYELAIDLGPVDDAKLEKALTAIWSHADLDGCYLRGDQEPAEQTLIVPGTGPGLDTCLRGVARLQGMAPVACSTIVVREDGGSDLAVLRLTPRIARNSPAGRGVSVGRWPRFIVAAFR